MQSVQIWKELMNNHTLTNRAATPGPQSRPSRMRLPLQAAPINRARDASATLGDGSGVQPAIDWGSLLRTAWQVAKQF